MQAAIAKVSRYDVYVCMYVCTVCVFRHARREENSKWSMYVSVYVGEEHLESGHPSHSRRGGGDC